MMNAGTLRQSLLNHPMVHYSYVSAAIWLMLLAFPVAAELLRGTVVGIDDGDSLTLLFDQTRYRVRLEQIDAPEHGQAWADRSKQALTEKVFNRQVTVRVSGTDQYHRLLGSLVIGERDINRELVAEGHAWAYRRYLKDEHLIEAESSARDHGLGLWSLPDPVPPWEWRVAQRKHAGTCNIKGNISSTGARIYHLPEQQHYEQTRISTSKGERWFCSESEARAAGWRKAKS